MKGSRFEFPATGTKWQVDLAKKYDEGKEGEIFFNLVRVADDFEKVYSRFRKDSLVSKMSKKVGIYSLPVNAEELFDFYFKLNKLTNGKFTPMVGELLNKAGYDTKYSLVPKATLSKLTDLNEALFYKFPSLEVKEKVELDFGAAGKGYLVDILGNKLEEMNVREYCIDAGGDMLFRSLTEVLRVGLENPTNFDQVIGVAKIQNQSLCGSSGSRRKWDKYHHIMDSVFLESPSDILATWVMAEKTMWADGIATSLFFTKPKELQKEFDFEFLILNSDFSIEKSQDFSADLF